MSSGPGAGDTAPGTKRPIHKTPYRVLPEFRKTGLDAALIRESIARAMERGVRNGECSWMLEDNTAMNRAIEQVGETECRRYRVYERTL